MNPPPSRRDLPNADGHNCFGCSPKNPAGLRLKFSTDGAAVYTELAVPEHLCGWSSIVHGGILAAICDETMSWAAIHLLKKIALTQSMTIEYLRPARIGSALAAEGRVRTHDGKNDAVMEALVAEKGGEPCARASARFKVFSPAVARRLKIADEASIRWFEALFDAP